MPQQRVHQRRVALHRPPHRVPHPDDTLGDVPAEQRDLRFAAVIRPGGGSWRAQSSAFSRPTGQETPVLWSGQ
jgi:hypothetical protein